MTHTVDATKSAEIDRQYGAGVNLCAGFFTEQYLKTGIQSDGHIIRPRQPEQNCLGLGTFHLKPIDEEVTEFVVSGREERQVGGDVGGSGKVDGIKDLGGALGSGGGDGRDVEEGGILDVGDGVESDGGFDHVGKGREAIVGDGGRGRDEGGRALVVGRGHRHGRGGVGKVESGRGRRETGSITSDLHCWNVILEVKPQGWMSYESSVSVTEGLHKNTSWIVWPDRMVTMALDPLWYRTASKEKRRIIVLDVRNDAIIRDGLRAGCS